MTEMPRTVGSHPARAGGFGRRPGAAAPEPAVESGDGTKAATAERPSSYLARHWRGELTLATAYWINGCLLSVLFVALTGGIDIAVGRHFTPLAWLGWLTVFWVAQAVLVAWQTVGIWRSARVHPDRGGRRLWAVVARVMVGLGLVSGAFEVAQRAVPQFDDALQLVAGDARMEPHTVALADGGKVVDVSGGITFGLADEVRAVLDANPGVRVVRLHSPGGRVLEAERLREMIRRRQLWTYVRGDCMSACTIVFQGGVQRWADHKARFGFHQPFAAGLYEYEERYMYASAMRDLIQWGASRDFARRAMEEPSTSMWFPTAFEVMQGGVATGISGPEMFAQRLEAPATPDAAEQVLATHPLFRLIAKHDPSAYEQIHGDIVYNFMGEKTFADVLGHLQPTLTRLRYKYLPVASDAMVVEGAQVLIEELRVVRARKPHFCAFFMNQHRDTAHMRSDISRLFDQALLARYAAALEGAIQSGASAPQTAPTPEAGELLLDKLFAQLAAVHGRDVEVFGQLETMNVDQVKACTMMEKLFEAALALPAPERLAALRYLFILRR